MAAIDPPGAEDARTHVLARLADDLEETSPGFAARLRVVAPSLDGELSPGMAQAFAESLRRLAVIEGPGRDAAQALLARPLADVATLSPDDLVAWCDAAATVAVHSVRAASTFAASSIEVLPGAPADRTSRLRDTAAAITRLAARHGGDPVVQRFAGAAGAAIARRGGRVAAAWAGLCEAAAFAARRAPEATLHLPEAAGLDDAELAAAIDVAAMVAARDRERGLRLFARLPEELARVPRHARPAATALLASLARSPEALADAVEVVAPVLRRAPREARPVVLEQAARIAGRLPAATPRWLRSVLRVGDALGFEAALVAFVDKGLELAEEQPQAALAFFALESRGSREFLKRHDSAALLDDVENTLRGYLQMIAMERRSIAGRDSRGLFPEIAFDDGPVPVATRADVFPNWEENFTLLKLQATLGSLWEEIGTRRFSVADWLGEPDQPGGLREMFLRFAEPEVAARLFAHLEAVRAAPVVRRRFPGLASDVAGLRRRVFPDDRPPAGHGAAEAVLFLALGGAADRVAFAAGWGEAVQRLAVRSAAGEATVYDSAAATEVLCERLAAGELIPVYSVDDWLEEDLAFSYMLEEEDEPRPGVPVAPRDGPESIVDESGDGHRSDESSPGINADAALLEAYLEQRPDLSVARAEEEIDAVGLFVSGLTGGGGDWETKPRGGPSPDRSIALARHGLRTNDVTLQDEWDYLIDDYRHQWCRVHEVAVDGDDGGFFAGTLARYADMLPEVRRQFQRVKPEGYRVIRGLLDGEDFDLNAVVMARGDLRARRTPSAKLYTARQREERDVATLFLLDMSASTDEETEPSPASAPTDPDAPAPPVAAALADDLPASPPGKKPRPRRIIDIQKEALVIMSQALEEIGDQYAIYGFSGHGRDCVEFFDVKSFDQPLNQAVRARIGAIEPQRSTRMGAALRQAIGKLRSVASRARHLILLSDGFPQDFDYGEDRRSNVYGLRDTTMALREAAAAGVQTFCITVDRAGHDYLREMCDAKRYLVIEDIAALPRELPKIYSEATRDA
ncbi:MAG: hypothetical protein RL698_1141 [Pseudomonadota bacterium]